VKHEKGNDKSGPPSIFFLRDFFKRSGDDVATFIKLRLTPERIEAVRKEAQSLINVLDDYYSVPPNGCKWVGKVEHNRCS